MLAFPLLPQRDHVASRFPLYASYPCLELEFDPAKAEQRAARPPGLSLVCEGSARHIEPRLLLQ